MCSPCRRADGSPSAPPSSAPNTRRAPAARRSWSLRISAAEPELRHLTHAWMYRTPLPRTKLTSPAPAARFDGVLTLPGTSSAPTPSTGAPAPSEPPRTIELRGWRGMVGHNWGTAHAERWIWLHGIGFEEDPDAWLDVAIGRIRLAGRTTPWVANGVLSLEGPPSPARRPRSRSVAGRAVAGRRDAGALPAVAPGERRARGAGARPRTRRGDRGLALQRPRRRRPRRRQLLDRGARAHGRAARASRPGPCEPSTAPPTSSACASATTACRSRPSPTAEQRSACWKHSD